MCTSKGNLALYCSSVDSDGRNYSTTLSTGIGIHLFRVNPLQKQASVEPIPDSLAQDSSWIVFRWQGYHKALHKMFHIVLLPSTGKDRHYQFNVYSQVVERTLATHQISQWLWHKRIEDHTLVRHTNTSCWDIGQNIAFFVRNATLAWITIHHKSYINQPVGGLKTSACILENGRNF